MSIAIYQRVAVTDAGDVIPGAEYTVINENTGVAAPIYSDRTGATLKTAPYFADSVGVIQFYIAQGTTFRVAASGGVGTYTDRYVYGISEAVLVQADGSTSINRLSTDGVLISLKKDGTTVGSWQSRAGLVSSLVLDTRSGSGGCGIGTTDGVAIVSTDNAGALVDSGKDLGQSGVRWRNLYLSGGVVFGTPSGSVSSNTLDDYEEGSWTLTNVSSGVDTGYYTKIGNMVSIFFDGDTTFSSDQTSLPFVALTGAPISFYGDGVAFGAGEIPNILAANSTIYFRKLNQSTGLFSAMTDLSGTFRLSAKYRTNS